MLPVRVLHRAGSQFYGYGPSCTQIEVMTSLHKKGKEPMGSVHVFGHSWEQERGSYMWDGVVYVSWRRVQ